MWLDTKDREANGAIRPDLTWRQKLILKAAADVEYIPLRFSLPDVSNIPTGVWYSLRDRGLLRLHPLGFEITPEGRKAL